jgi:hypothetical protein
MLRPIGWACCLLALLGLGGATNRATADVAAQRAALYAGYGPKLAELAAWCEQRQLTGAAEQLRGWLPPRDREQFVLFALPSACEQVQPPTSAEADWQGRWKTLRDAQAEALFTLARRAIENRQPSLAYQLVTEAVRENPDHAAARRVLGYVRYRDAWHTPFEIRQLSGGKVWHQTLGWLPKAHVARYERGERFYQGRWMPAADEAKLRADLARGWRVESDHYVVTTNHSLEAGVRLSRQLEQLHAIWQQVFIGYLADAGELKRRFAGRATRPAAKQHQVVYFRTRDEYNDELRAAQPRIDITLGIYLDTTRVAYFFAAEDAGPGTLYHEATHQLFQESRRVVPDVGRRDNFWVIEGVACYMESLADSGDHFTLGGPNAGRMPAARHRLLVDKFYVPLAELVRLGMDALQNDERLPRLYSQAAGLCDFLLHHRDGRYREALVDYLVAVYTGRATADALAEVTGQDYATLDRQYAEFMSQGADGDVPIEPPTAEASARR